MYFVRLYIKGFHIAYDLFDTQYEFISYNRVTNDYSIKIPFTHMRVQNK